MRFISQNGTARFAPLALAMTLVLAPGCVRAPIKRPDGSTVQFETTTYSFEISEIASPAHEGLVPAPRVRNRKDDRILIDFSKQHPASEWVQALENEHGVVAGIDSAIEGRSPEIILLFNRVKPSGWNEISLKKPHFSTELIRLSLSGEQISIRLRMEPGTTDGSQVTGRGRTRDGDRVEFSDWIYHFKRKSWILSRKPLKF